MPMYTVSTKTPLHDPVKLKIAHAITNIHCELTGAPKSFVNVVFSENVPLRRHVALNIFGNIRKGRTPEMNRELSDSLVSEIGTLSSTAKEAIEISLFEVPATWVVEGGEVLPEPGEEDQCDWLHAESVTA